MSSKRPQRIRREVNKDNEMPDSSPSRPTKRRRMTATDKSASPHVPAPLPLDRSGVDMNDDQLVVAISNKLRLPAYPVAISDDHANQVHQSVDTVEAYAKLAGQEWTYYIKEIENNIGRKPADLQAEETASQAPIHIDLGPNKTVSRNHAVIFFRNDIQVWAIEVQGRNGARINGKTYRKGDMTQLSSGQVIEIGGVEMVFVLPDQPLSIHKTYLRRAHLIQEAAGDDTTSGDDDGESPSMRRPTAPAAPSYPPPGTPGNNNSKPSPAMVGRPPFSGTMVMHSDDIDLSLETNAHMKPLYSYAQIISQAIFDSPDERMTLNGIYNFITTKYAFYRFQNPAGWQNSIRHNLSLNKGFIKVPRTTEEPGKGMKWAINPEMREELLKNSTRGGRGGFRSSTAPSSPANLGYVNRSSTHMPSGDPSSAQRRSPHSGSPPVRSYPSNGPHFTPNRGGHLLTSLQDNVPGDGSPLPRHRRAMGDSFLSENVPGSPPVLSSSYLQEDNSSFITPAPHRVHPRLAPPSTAQRPSQVMPTSSPAPFWKYADANITPMKGNSFESSPIKRTNHVMAPSSSPAPVRGLSPSRNDTPLAVKREIIADEDQDEDNQHFDLTKGFQSIGAYHGNGVTRDSRH